MSDLAKRATNDALHANPNVFHYPATSDINITTHGSDWYWAVTAVMATASLVFLGMSYTVPRNKRIFHYITASITLVATIAYFTMASNLGYASIIVEFQRSDPKVAGVYREIFYVRYIDWFVTTPLLLLDLLLTAGLPWPTVVYTVLMDEIMIVTGLVGALVASSYKWGYYIIGCLALFVIAFNVVFVGRMHARAIGPHVGKVYTICGTWTIFLWFLYPIAWGVCEGANVISPDSEAVFYGILDILAKPCFGALLLWGHRNIDPATLGLVFRDYDEAPNAGGHAGLIREKRAEHDNTVINNGANGADHPVTDNTTTNV